MATKPKPQAKKPGSVKPKPHVCPITPDDLSAAEERAYSKGLNRGLNDGKEFQRSVTVRDCLRVIDDRRKLLKSQLIFGGAALREGEKIKTGILTLLKGNTVE